MNRLGTLNSRQLRHQVWIDEPIASQNETGEEIITWMPRSQLWCSIEPISGREALRANEIIADMDTRITMRWSPFASTITAKWRFRFLRTGTVYDIARPPVEKALGMRQLEFMCSSGLIAQDEQALDADDSLGSASLQLDAQNLGPD